MVVEGAGGIDVVWTGVEVRSGVVDVLSGVVVVAFVDVSCCEDVGGLVGWAGMSLEKELTAKRGHYEQKLGSSESGEGQESCQAGTCCFPGGQRAFYGGQRSFAAES